MAALFAKSAGLLAVCGAQAPVDPEIYAPESPTTWKGCECTTPCQASHEVFCYSQMTCKVKSPFCKHGTASVDPGSGAGFFDFCTFEAYTPYESKSASEKEGLLWSKVKADPQVGYDYVWPDVTEMYRSDLHVSTQSVSDVFPYAHKKYMHAWGTVAPVRFESFANHNYTGLFKGAESGLIRLGMTLPSYSQNGVWFKGVIAGAALKLFRDGYPSGNLFAIPTIKPQECGSNFFEKYLSTHILIEGDTMESPFTAFAGGKLPQVTLCPTAVGISHMAMESDRYSDNDIFPWKVELYTEDHVANIDCDDHPSSLANFTNLGSNGTELFQVWATRFPGADREQIGRIVLKDAFTLSKFGDEQLFFKHQALEEDFARKPEWLKLVNKTDLCGLDEQIGPLEIGVGKAIPKRSEGCIFCGLIAHKEFCAGNSSTSSDMLDSDVVVA